MISLNKTAELSEAIIDILRWRDADEGLTDYESMLETTSYKIIAKLRLMTKES